MTFEEKIDLFIDYLSNYKTNSDTFNPWRDFDSVYDYNSSAPSVRCKNLREYLLARKSSKIILIAEALSYQGGKFTGIAMTSEKLLSIRTSNPVADLGNASRKKNGFSENTASIVEKVLIHDLQLNPVNFVKWNTYPFHPHRMDNMLSNRTPTNEEILASKHILQQFLEIFQNKRIVAVGNIAHQTLTKFFPEHSAEKVRHPAYGGDKDFAIGIKKIIVNI
ncbi:MAG: hypothetical protein LBU68_02390 [Rickettsiales bacterium]|jgi:hypothetical protein|nr:hypothetical protein [Rickettsiales bacterium]